MSRDILSEYGPESKSKGSGAEDGGIRPGEEKQIPYSPPKGPTGQMRQGPGLGGTNHGNCGSQGCR